MSDERELKDETNIPQSGDWVFYFPLGDRGAKPIPAMVTEDTDNQRALMLELHYHGNISYASASKHMDALATPRDRERSGGWAWNRKLQPLKPVKKELATATASK